MYICRQDLYNESYSFQKNIMKVIFIWIYDVYFFFIMIYVVYLHLYGESLFYKKVNYIVLFYTSCQDLKKKKTNFKKLYDFEKINVICTFKSLPFIIKYKY